MSDENGAVLDRFVRSTPRSTAAHVPRWSLSVEGPQIRSLPWPLRKLRLPPWTTVHDRD
jgi:hypothetical protein